MVGTTGTHCDLCGLILYAPGYDELTVKIPKEPIQVPSRGTWTGGQWNFTKISLQRELANGKLMNLELCRPCLIKILKQGITELEIGGNNDTEGNTEVGRSKRRESRRQFNNRSLVPVSRWLVSVFRRTVDFLFVLVWTLSLALQTDMTEDRLTNYIGGDNG